MPARADADEDHCRRLLRDADRDLYLSSLFMPAEHRRAVTAIYAFHIEIGRIRKTAHEAIAVAIRLQWWREVLANERAGEAAAHPVARALLEAVSRYALSPDVFLQALDAEERDVQSAPLLSLSDLNRHLAAAYGSSFAAPLTILTSHAADPTIGAEAAVAYGLYMLLRDFGSERSGQRIPEATLQKHNAGLPDYRQGHLTPEWKSVFADLRDHAREALDIAAAERPRIAADGAQALLPLAVIRPTLALMERPGFDPFRPRALSDLRRQWAMWRAWRKAARLLDAR